MRSLIKSSWAALQGLSLGGVTLLSGLASLTSVRCEKPHHRCTRVLGGSLASFMTEKMDCCLGVLAFGRRGLEQALEERHRKKSNSLRHSKQNCDYLEDAH